MALQESPQPPSRLVEPTWQCNYDIAIFDLRLIFELMRPGHSHRPLPAQLLPALPVKDLDGIKAPSHVPPCPGSLHQTGTCWLP